ncbi:MAG: shikimate kinase [Actinomycetota bacterium]|nr:shikimate kinase [Actinomycetota bacterium]MDQ3574324.1 shikimate kinase [Actinomycetota bacterium]
MTDETPTRILLVGMMGSGKTTVGRSLATRLGYPYLDSDEQVERRTGHTVREIFEVQGEAAFRQEEKRALAEALSIDGPVVVSVAGGAVLDADNRRRLQEAGLVVWLKAGVATLAERVVGAQHRPLLGDDPLHSLTRLNLRRRPLYEELADLVIDVEQLTPEEVTEQIVQRVRS